MIFSSRLLVALATFFACTASGIVADRDGHGQENEARGRDYDHALKSWPSWGGDLHNTRSYSGPDSDAISLKTVKDLKTQKFISTSSGVPATPTFAGDGTMYFTDNAGKLHCNDKTTGSSLWTFDVTAFLTSKGIVDNGFNHLVSRSSPTIFEDAVYIGTLAGGYVIKLNRFNKKVLWAKRVSTHPYVVITQSMRVYDGKVFVGTASNEEQAAAFIPGYALSFIGTFSALDDTTGDVLWSQPIVPSDYTGGAVWGSETPIDVYRNQILVATGNPYDVSAETEACRVNQTGKAVTFPDPCRREDDLAESIVAFDIDTGYINWKFSQSAVEAWTIACGIDLPDLYFTIPRNSVACPQTPGPDIDYGMAPIFVRGVHGVTPKGRDTLYTGQKSGMVWANSAETGELMWATSTGNGGAAGGGMFGDTTDGVDFFYAQTNSGKEKYRLVNGSMTTLGHIGSMSLLNGTIKWQTTFNCFLNAPLAHSNGLIYVSCGQVAGSAPGGQFYILNAKTGDVKFSMLGTVGNRANGVAILGDKVYLPSGYTADSTAGGIYILGFDKKK